jgi:pyruvate dehydrogenase E2 component (dihydrolipoamide acetyltransferase)
MLKKINMPSMGATMEEGTIISWRVQTGDQVKVGDIILELETDKSTFEFECPCEGTVREIIVQKNETVPVGELIAIIGDANEEIPAGWLAKPEPVKSSQASATIVCQQTTAHIAQTQSVGIKVKKISPKARKLAQELNGDISGVVGSGPGGRIESSDIENAASSSIAAAPAGNVIPLDPTRKQINAAVTKSKQQIPHFYIQTAIDMTDVVNYRNKLSKDGQKISYNAILFKAAVEGIKVEPAFNYGLDGDNYFLKDSIDLGLAVETPKGVVIVVLDDIESKSIEDVSGEMTAIIEKSRRDDLESVKLNGACMTISNLGMYRVGTFIPIIHPGETAIMGVGTIADTPIVADGQVVIRKMMPVTLCVDHRITDGSAAACFLEAFAKYLETLK